MMRVCCFLLVVLVLSTTSEFGLAQDSDSRDLREKQEVIACELARNDTFAEIFKSLIRQRHGVDPGDHSSTRLARLTEHDSLSRIRCRERSCSGDVTWCIYIYHPTEDIELCLNRSGEINATAYAHRLGLDRGGFKISHENNNLIINDPPYFMSDSYLTCTVDGADCYSKIFHSVTVQKAPESAIRPNVTIHHSNKLNLGERNIVLCTAEFKYQQTDALPREASCTWRVNNATTKTMSPSCDPLANIGNTDCFEGSGRIRFYQMNYHESDCPLRTFLYYSWMVIENATKADTEQTYECQGRFLALNPTEHYLSTSVQFSPLPVYPLIDVVTMATPLLPPGHNSLSTPTYLLQPDETVQWSCSVKAGVGDRLVWTHNGIELTSLNIIPVDDKQQNLTCSLISSTGVFVVSKETVELGEFERQFTSTLFLCRVTELTAGLYECVVNRSREERENVKLWSAKVVSATTTPSPNKSQQDVITIIIGVSVGLGTALLVLIFAAILLGCCSRIKRQKRKRQTDWTRDIYTMDDLLHNNIARYSTVCKDKSSSLPLQGTDPYEFPRNKLVFLNTVLGEGTFGVVLQAKAEHIVKSAPHRNIVAVKTPREKAPPHEIDNFWEELNLMKSILPHNNVVNLLGHCTTPGGPIYMIIEYARYGSLKDFLKQCEDVVLQLNHIPQIQYYRSHHSCSTYSPSSTCSAYPQLLDKIQLSGHGGVFSPDVTSTPGATSTPGTTGTGMFEFPPTKLSNLTRERLTTQDSGFYGEMVESLPQAAFNDLLDGAPIAHSVAPLTHDYVNSKGLLYMEDVQNFALQIACGLKHLEDVQIVHCDLAARNILIAEGFVLKIGDFGMARDVSEKEYYRKHGGRVPVKWTAPEALKDHIFTFKSDVWSFGVVLWEILTYGQHPYAQFKIRDSWEPFINYLMEGNILPQPKGCPDALYDLMQSCWHSCPDKRPTAEELVHFLSLKDSVLTNETVLESVTDSPTDLKKPVAVGSDCEDDSIMPHNHA